MSETEHTPSIREYDWVIGTKWRWDCSCAAGSGGYTNGEAAERAFEGHLRAQAMWERRRALDEEESR